MVYAGATTQGIGGVRIYSEPADPSQPGFAYVGQYVDNGAPALMVASYGNDSLTLDGASSSFGPVTFNLRTDQFS